MMYETVKIRYFQTLINHSIIKKSFISTVMATDFKMGMKIIFTIKLKNKKKIYVYIYKLGK